MVPLWDGLGGSPDDICPILMSNNSIYHNLSQHVSYTCVFPEDTVDLLRFPPSPKKVMTCVVMLNTHGFPCVPKSSARWAAGRQRRPGDVRTPGRLRAAGGAWCHEVLGHHEFGASAGIRAGRTADGTPDTFNFKCWSIWGINKWIYLYKKRLNYLKYQSAFNWVSI